MKLAVDLESLSLASDSITLGLLFALMGDLSAAGLALVGFAFIIATFEGLTVAGAESLSTMNVSSSSPSAALLTTSSSLSSDSSIV